MNNLEELTINTIRMLSLDAITAAGSGHPGLPLGAAPMGYTLWARHLKHNPKNPDWKNRDRFVLSAGHGSILLYSLLHLFDYPLSLDDLRQFRQWGSKAPGHPEYGHTVGVETTTGPLGQGFANGVGMAVAEKYLANHFNRPDFPIVDHYTYVLAGDGCMMEGVTSEAASFAGSMGLGKLIVMYDSNAITIEGKTEITFQENTEDRFKAYGWHTVMVDDGNDIAAISQAIQEAKAETKRPSLITIKTIIGYGCLPNQGKPVMHGEPCSAENLKSAKEFLCWNHEQPFTVPEEVRTHIKEFVSVGETQESIWYALFDKYQLAYPELAKEWRAWHSESLEESIFDFDTAAFPKKISTRSASGEILNALALKIPNLMGGAADLAPSTKTQLKNRGNFTADHPGGANLHYGVREHAMAAIGNGIVVHGGLKSYVSTFLVFSDYMKGAMRLSALMKLPLVYILTHDSIGVGEDGPTHQPIEQLAALRSIPNFTVFRPADMNETIAGWKWALRHTTGPTALILSRQDLPVLDSTGPDAIKGAYVIYDSSEKEPDLILLATGSEVQLILLAAKQLKDQGFNVRAVSMPSWEIFIRQSKDYIERVLPKNIRARIAVEAASSFGWHQYIGLDGEVISIDTFGASAPADKLFDHFGVTVKNITEKALKLLENPKEV